MAYSPRDLLFDFIEMKRGDHCGAIAKNRMSISTRHPEILIIY